MTKVYTTDAGRTFYFETYDTMSFWPIQYQAVSMIVDARWHLIQDRWALVDEDDGEVLALVHEDRGIWVVGVDELNPERYISLSQAKARAEEVAGPVNIVHAQRQNSAGIP